MDACVSPRELISVPNVNPWLAWISENESASPDAIVAVAHAQALPDAASRNVEGAATRRTPEGFRAAPLVGAPGDRHLSQRSGAPHVAHAGTSIRPIKACALSGVMCSSQWRR